MRKNLSTTERGIRLLLALALVPVLLQRLPWGWLELTLAIAALLLVLNALSGRCYLWRWLGLGKRHSPEEDHCAIDRAHEDASRD